MDRPRTHAHRWSRRARPGAALLALALVGAACSTGGSDASSTTTTEVETSSGGPTTTTAAPSTDPGTEGDRDAGSPVRDGIRIEVLSSQPDRATGPDARVRVTPARGASVDDLRVQLGGVDVTDALAAVDGRLEGVVTGLVEGTNDLIAEAGDETVTQRIRSWPLTGPMISGPHAPLLACSTESHGLGAASDADCSAPTKVSWQYVTTTNAVKPLADPQARPADLATATVGGDDVPLIVRYEQGVVNRSVYEIASLDPTPGGADADQGDAAWNGRLLYRFGDGCRTTYGQGTAQVSALDPTYLARGYAIATATFNTGAVQCNDVVSAETTMMVKERFIEEFGEPSATIGVGSGFGAAQLHLVLQNYPGLVDGSVAIEPLPDVLTVAGPAADCALLNRYYRSPEGRALTVEQRTAINGHATNRTCDRWEQVSSALLGPTSACDPRVPAEARYDATTKPGGARCTFQDGSANQYGRDPATGQAVRPIDNVGLQYGLEALNAGELSLEEFVSLNRSIGGWDLDGAHQADRHEADPIAVQTAYESGQVSTGVGDQRKVPLVEVSTYDDPAGTITDQVRPISLRDRLTQGAPPESVPGYQIWTRSPSAGPTARTTAEAVASVDEWLDALAADRTGGHRSDALQRARPAEAVDNCLAAPGGKPLRGVDVFADDGACLDDFPVRGGPRIAAGGPRSDDVVKCRLKPVDPADYDVELSEAQYDDLLTVFPDGVCDWSAAGVGQTTPSMSDRSYEDVITPGELA